MAQRVNVVLVDDIDESAAVETVTFSLDGISYEIDLNEEHSTELRDAMAVWVGHARRLGGARSGARKGRSTARNSGGTGADSSAVREWARANGYTVSDRGRIKGNVLAAYQAANG